MTQPTDNKARMSFDMGSTIAKFTITNIKIEEILEAVVVIPLGNEEENDTTVIGPNPTGGILRIENLEQMNTLEMTDAMGRVFLEKNVKGQKSVEIDLSHKPEGMYLLKLKGDKKEFIRKVIKK